MHWQYPPADPGGAEAVSYTHLDVYKRQVECTGLLLVRSGQLRAYILSDEGREISLYRLFDRDMCLFSASCITVSYTHLLRRLK